MILNYFKLAIRLLLRNPFFTFINVLGLSVGFAIFLTLWQYSGSELISDRQWNDWRRIARLGFRYEWTDDGQTWDESIHGNHATGIMPLVANDFPELESYTRIVYQQDFNEPLVGLERGIVVEYQSPERSSVFMKEDKVVCVDANFFEFFSAPFLAGDRATALKQPNTVVMSRSVARRYFADQSPLEKIVLVNGNSFMVTGVFEDLPHNSHLEFEIALSNASKLAYWAVVRPHPNVNGYLKSKQKINWANFAAKINEENVIQKYFGEILKLYPNGRITNIVQPLEEVVFSNWRGNNFEPRSIRLLNILRTVGVVILVMAVFNFINLNAARISRRLKEIAARKVVGARTSDFAIQFLIESLLVFGLAICMGLTLVQVFGKVMHETFRIPPSTIDATGLTVVVLTALGSIVLTVSYPVYITRLFEPNGLFRKLKNGGPKRPVMLSLTTIQFVIALILMVWGSLVYVQLNFILKKSLGFDRDAVIVIDAPIIRTNNFENDVSVFQNKLQDYSEIRMVTACTSIMGDFADESVHIRQPGSDYPLVLMSNGGINESFLPFFGIELLAGRNFQTSEISDAIIISDGARLRLGFISPEAAVGARIEMLSQRLLVGEAKWIEVEIIGVAKSYRLRPMLVGDDEQMLEDSGIVLTYKTSLRSDLKVEKIALRLNGEDFEKTLAHVGSEYAQLFPGNVFRWYFLDENINRHYQGEKVWRNRVLFFTCVSVAIACLGLLGMISNTAVEKTKEIGIRKVMGASVFHLAHLLLNNPIRQLFVATAIGIPVAWYMSQQYLQKFSEQIELDWWHYVLPVGILVSIMMTTMASVIGKAIHANPVEALRAD